MNSQIRRALYGFRLLGRAYYIFDTSSSAYVRSVGENRKSRPTPGRLRSCLESSIPCLQIWHPAAKLLRARKARYRPTPAYGGPKRVSAPSFSEVFEIWEFPNFDDADSFDLFLWKLSTTSSQTSRSIQGFPIGRENPTPEPAKQPTDQTNVAYKAFFLRWDRLWGSCIRRAASGGPEVHSGRRWYVGR